MTKRPGPDYLLAERESAQRLSEMFYFAEPHEYFSWRFYLLVLAGDASKDLGAFAREGISFAGFSIGPSDAIDEDEKEVQRRYSFAVAEAAALLHHVSETLLRLYFAHCDLPPAPWLEVAREKNFTKFKDKVRMRFVAAETTAEDYARVATVFFGAANPKNLRPVPDERSFNDAVENIDRWLRFFAANFLDDAHLYNALKHGLAVNAGDSSMKIDDGSVISADGPSLLYLGERETGERRLWSLTTRWINLGNTVAMIYVGIRLMQMLWEVSKARYTEERPDQIRVFTAPPLDEFLKSMGEGILITKMSMDLAYSHPALGRRPARHRPHLRRRR